VEWGQFSLSDSPGGIIEAISHGVNRYYIGLCFRMRWNLGFLPLRHLILMYMTVSLMVIDTQDMRAVRKHAFPALSRSF